MKNLLIAGTAVLCLMSGPAFAQDKELDEVNRIAFESIDANNDGLVSTREVEQYRELVMLSIDGNNDKHVTRKEYMEWAMGWQHLAAQRGHVGLYRNARRKVFQAWDHDDDGRLSPEEQSQSQVKDFFEASGKTNQPMNLKQFATELRIIAELNKAFTAAEPVTLINVFTVPTGKEAEALAFWEAGAKFLEAQPGYISTALHKAMLPNAKHSLINVAKWESVKAFKEATAAMRAAPALKPFIGLMFDASLYTVVRSD